MKEIIFHPEARAEMREAVEFYEAQLDGLGLRFLSSSSRQRNGFPPIQMRAPRSVVNSASESFVDSRTTSFIVSGKITSTSLPSLTNTVVQAIGATGPAVANHRLEKALRASQP